MKPSVTCLGPEVPVTCSDGPVPERLGRPVNDSAPQISVVIASVNGLPYPLACLESLASQDGDISAEVVLADCTGPATVAAVRERFPDVRLLAFDDRMSVPFLRAAGIREARGRLVAVTEDHCVPREDWYRQMVAAHLQRFKQYPPTAKAAGQQGTARVSFTLSRSGAVLSVGLGGSSGHSALDAETLAMVRRAQPFPAFPADVKQSSMPFSAPVAFYIR